MTIGRRGVDDPYCPTAMSRRSFIAELFDFILSHKAYFIAPIIVVLLLVGALIILGGTKAAPFIYTLF